MKKNIKVVYYTDIWSDVKGTICAYPLDANKEEVINFVSKAIYDALGEVLNFLSTNETKKIVEDILCEGCGEYGDYEFGVEEIPFNDCK